MLRELLELPTPEELELFLRTHLHDDPCLVQVAGECEITYSGRAVSMADAGDYLILVKQDGSLQVHACKGVKPRNWQAITDDLTIHRDEGRVVLNAWRRKPEEVVRVVFLQPAVAMALFMQDESGFLLQGTEEQMRAAISKHPEIIEPGLKALHEELPTGVGDIDFYGRDQEGRYVVVELKRGKATQEAVHQLERYVMAVKPTVTAPVRGILAAPDITAPALKALLSKGLEFVRVTALPEQQPVVTQAALF